MAEQWGTLKVILLKSYRRVCIFFLHGICVTYYVTNHFGSSDPAGKRRVGCWVESLIGSPEHARTGSARAVAGQLH